MTDLFETHVLANCQTRQPVPEVEKEDAEWAKELDANTYAIFREKATERPFTGELLHEKRPGVYHCAGCDTPLFTHNQKFDSGCGWPSFDSSGIENTQADADDPVVYVLDDAHGMQRVEIVCRACGGHLGHVFPDGPTETGLRYCVNSLSLQFTAQDSEP